ncbi:Uncharacterized protein PBTT_10216 [Plasmodiophora brassicae]|uniref:Uncharacterized protein n=1 Tax=Plasmodiophora brassicae TaxID=37360 RepID=A0A3P3YNX5_PLABS|nr:unnamed protein product [Plasmodiophora brassicae]
MRIAIVMGAVLQVVAGSVGYPVVPGTLHPRASAPTAPCPCVTPGLSQAPAPTPLPSLAPGYQYGYICALVALPSNAFPTATLASAPTSPPPPPPPPPTSPPAPVSMQLPFTDPPIIIVKTPTSPAIPTPPGHPAPPASSTPLTAMSLPGAAPPQKPGDAPARDPPSRPPGAGVDALDDA